MSFRKNRMNDDILHPGKIEVTLFLENLHKSVLLSIFIIQWITAGNYERERMS